MRLDHRRMLSLFLNVLFIDLEEENESDESHGDSRNEPEMNLASDRVQPEDVKSNGVSDRVKSCWKQSLAAFHEGIEIFKSANDKANEALLNSNCGRLMRTAAAAYANLNEEFNQQERYNMDQVGVTVTIFLAYVHRISLKAIEFYSRALECVNRSSDPLVWESVAWETSSLFFNFAILLQERPPLSSVSVEEVSVKLELALRLA